MYVHIWYLCFFLVCDIRLQCTLHTFELWFHPWIWHKTSRRIWSGMKQSWVLSQWFLHHCHHLPFHGVWKLGFSDNPGQSWGYMMLLLRSGWKHDPNMSLKNGNQPFSDEGDARQTVSGKVTTTRLTLLQSLIYTLEIYTVTAQSWKCKGAQQESIFFMLVF